MKIKFLLLLVSFLSVNACNQKTEKVTVTKNNEAEAVSENRLEDEISGTYTAEDCDISIVISKIKNDYQYILKTNTRNLKGKANYSKNDSGEKYITLEGIPWDEYEGDISNEEENDSVSDSKPGKKELEIPVGIGALYVKDTLTIQNYGNAMNYYTKISECGLKYIQLIKK